MITDINKLDLNKSYTYSDYITWLFKERVELIKGKIFKMVPAPSYEHQRISSVLHGLFWSYLRKQACNVLSAPFDVRFYSKDALGNSSIKDTVQPDICVICDKSKIDERGCLGAPDLIVEILSPSTSEIDLTYKYDLYESNGVKEYWLVHPSEKTLIIYTLNEQDKYMPSRLFSRLQTIHSTVIEGLSIDLSEVFEPFDWDKVEEEETNYRRI